MRRGIGAIFTTGVALVGATIVVANPVSAPPSDVRVPAVKLSSGSTTSSAALDQALLEAIARDPAESSPADLFKRSVAGAVTTVTLLSGRAVEEVFTRPAVAATPVRVPSPPPPAPLEVVADLLSGKPANGPAADITPVIDNPGLQQAVTSVADYVGYVSVQAVETADAAGAIVVAEPERVADTLAALARGDVDNVITTALRAAAAPLGPPSMVVNAIRTEVRKRLTELADLARRSVPPPPRVKQVTRPVPTERTRSLRVALGHRRGSAVTTKPLSSANSTDQAAPDVKKPMAANGATDLTDGNKVAPRKKSPQSELRQRAEASLNQARDSLERLGDALGKALTPPKLPRLSHRAHRH